MIVTESKTIFSNYSEYAQSANTLFHFMREEKYLLDALAQKSLDTEILRRRCQVSKYKTG